MAGNVLLEKVYELRVAKFVLNWLSISNIRQHPWRVHVPPPISSFHIFDGVYRLCIVCARLSTTSHCLCTHHFSAIAASRKGGWRHDSPPMTRMGFENNTNRLCIVCARLCTTVERMCKTFNFFSSLWWGCGHTDPISAFLQEQKAMKSRKKSEEIRRKNPVLLSWRVPGSSTWLLPAFLVAGIPLPSHHHNFTQDVFSRFLMTYL